MIYFGGFDQRIFIAMITSVICVNVRAITTTPLKMVAQLNGSDEVDHNQLYTASSVSNSNNHKLKDLLELKDHLVKLERQVSGHRTVNSLT